MGGNNVAVHVVAAVLFCCSNWQVDLLEDRHDGFVSVLGLVQYGLQKYVIDIWYITCMAACTS